MSDQNINSKRYVILQAIKFTLFSMSAGLIQTGVFALLHDALANVLGWNYWP